jgi:hypothetical protein
MSGGQLAASGLNGGFCTACGPAGHPDPSWCAGYGKEWDPVGESDCGTCKLSGTVVGGKTITCRHVRYLGAMEKCCLGTPLDPQTTCDPSFTMDSPKCLGVLGYYCSKVLNPLTDLSCLKWADKNPSAYETATAAYCAANLSSPACKTWCKNKSVRGNGVCDGLSVAWCKSHPTDPYCACISSPLQDPKIGINPKCNDAACLRGGYMLQNMFATACPDITNCTMQNILSNSGVELSNFTFDQRCGNQTNASTPAVSGGGAGPTTTTLTSDGTAQADPGVLARFAASMRQHVMMMFVFLILVAVCLAVFVDKEFLGNKYFSQIFK